VNILYSPWARNFTLCTPWPFVLFAISDNSGVRFFHARYHYGYFGFILVKFSLGWLSKIQAGMNIVFGKAGDALNNCSFGYVQFLVILIMPVNLFLVRRNSYVEVL